MKKKVIKVVVLTMMACTCTLPFASKANALQLTPAAGEVESKTVDPYFGAGFEKLKDFNDSVHDRLGNLIDINIGEVGDVDVSTKDDVNVDIDNVNINININLGNINIGRFN